MTPEDLKNHKTLPKKLKKIPVFNPLKRNKLPKSFNKIGGPRIHATEMLEVSDTHVVFMYWRDGEIFTDRSFYAFLFCRLGDGSLSPLFEFHWHPSHKPFHCMTPCKTTNNYTNRTLPGAPELKLKTEKLDPKFLEDRNKLIITFCKACGVSSPDTDPSSRHIWA